MNTKCLVLFQTYRDFLPVGDVHNSILNLDRFFSNIIITLYGKRGPDIFHQKAGSSPDTQGISRGLIHAEEHLPFLNKYLQNRVCRCTYPGRIPRSEEHTSELQSLMRISYA